MNIIILLFYFPKRGDRFETIAYKPIVQRRTDFYTQCCMGGEIGSSLVNMIKGL